MTCFRECFGFVAGAKDDRYAVLSFKNMSSFWRTGAEFMAIRELRGLFAASLFAVAVVTGGPAAAEPAGPGELAVGPSEPITVKVLTVNGSGCPDGTATVTPLAGNTGFSIAYSDYVASVSGSATPTDFRKNCQISLVIQAPQGFSYAIAKADYSGTARLAEGATGLERANYYFQGSAADSWSDHQFTGPLYGGWQVSDTAAELLYSPCGTARVLNVNTELRVDDGASSTTSSLRMTSSSGDITTVYHFSWKQCS